MSQNTCQTDFTSGEKLSESMPEMTPEHIPEHFPAIPSPYAG